MDPVVHFEMPYDDAERAASFYQKVFGWQTQMTGPEMGNYIVLHTTETDANNMVKEPGRINGGLFKKNGPDPKTNIVIAVKDINATIEKIKAAGCKTDDVIEIPGIGKYCTFFDTEGNRVSALQPNRM